MKPSNYDYCLVGGGLQAGLIALSVRFYQPLAKVLILEKENQTGGNQTWSCHQTDIPDSAATWFSKIPAHRWPGYLVRTKNFVREIKIGYQSIRAPQFHDYVKTSSERSDDNFQIRCGTVVTNLTQDEVTLSSGERIMARCVIDCRGFPTDAHQACGLGYQKFFGWEVQLLKPWPHRMPIIMDIDDNQADGFRFTYSLPFARHQVLLQDTRFSNHASVDVSESKQVLAAYLEAQGHPDFVILREEHGCLPMPYHRFRPDLQSLLMGGYRGGWFHAATGYSLPLAIRFADAISRVGAGEAHQAIAELWRQHKRQSAGARFLNRMLFCLVRPNSRQRIFKHFYKSLPESVISRFYAHRFSRFDLLRLMSGRPPAGLTPIKFLKSYRSSP